MSSNRDKEHYSETFARWERIKNGVALPEDLLNPDLMTLHLLDKKEKQQEKAIVKPGAASGGWGTAWGNCVVIPWACVTAYVVFSIFSSASDWYASRPPSSKEIAERAEAERNNIYTEVPEYKGKSEAYKKCMADNRWKISYYVQCTDKGILNIEADKKKKLVIKTKERKEFSSSMDSILSDGDIFQAKKEIAERAGGNIGVLKYSMSAVWLKNCSLVGDENEPVLIKKGTEVTVVSQEPGGKTMIAFPDYITPSMVRSGRSMPFCSTLVESNSLK